MGGSVIHVAWGVLAYFDWHYPFYVYGLGILLMLFVATTLFEPRPLKKVAHVEDLARNLKLYHTALLFLWLCDYDCLLHFTNDIPYIPLQKD